MFARGLRGLSGVVAGIIACVLWGSANDARADGLSTGLVGVAKVDITPDGPVRMYGYGARTTESEGVAGRLKAAALAIGGDEGDGPAVLLCVDCGAVPAPLRASVLRRLQAKTPAARTPLANTPLKAERFMLCNSHNHSGPDLKGMKEMTGGEREHLAAYAQQLTDRLTAVVQQALAARRPGQLAWAQGTHEYRPMGSAVIARNGVFSPRDFHPRRRCPHRHTPAFVGFFASLGHVNRFLKARGSPPRYRGMAIL